MAQEKWVCVARKAILECVEKFPNSPELEATQTAEQDNEQVLVSNKKQKQTTATKIYHLPKWLTYIMDKTQRSLKKYWTKEIRIRKS